MERPQRGRDDRVSRLDDLRASPFFQIEIGQATQIPDFLEANNAWLEEDETYSAKARLGQILCSAIVHGALLDRSGWQDWLKAVVVDRVQAEFAWFCYGRPGSRSYPRQWFADPITLSLLRRRTTRCSPSQAGSAESCLIAFLEHRHRAKSRKFDESAIDQLLAWSTMQWRLRMPALLVDQALGNCQTTALSAETFTRLINGEREEFRDDEYRPRPSSRDEFKASSDWFNAFRRNESAESRAFEHARKMRRRSEYSLRQVKRLCASFLLACKTRDGQPHLSPARHRLIDWCVAQLTLDRAYVSKGYAPFTVEGKLIAILEGVFAGEYPTTSADIEPDNILKRLSHAEAVEESDVRVAMMRRAAHDFIRFTTSPEDWEKYIISHQPTSVGLANLPDTDEEAEDLESIPFEGVRPEIISDVEFARCVTKAKLTDRPGDLAIMLMLGFRAGLRMGEIVGLETSDFVASDKHFELHLQKNRYRSLKTEQSRRIIPLDVLLPWHEQKFLRKWLKTQEDAAVKSNRPLLCFGPIGGKILPFDQFYAGRAEEILKTVTGRSLTFHCLRHSFATYLTLKLLLPEPRSELLIPKAFRNLVTWKHKSILHNRLVGRGSLSQPMMHAVSMLMGHSGIPRTLKSYQHLLDLAVYLYCARSASQVPLSSFLRKQLGEEPAPSEKQNRDLVDDERFLPSYLKREHGLHAQSADHRPLVICQLAVEDQGDFQSSGREPEMAPKKRAGNVFASARPSPNWRLILEWMSVPENSDAARELEKAVSPKQLENWRRSRPFIFAQDWNWKQENRLCPPRGQIAEEIVEVMWRRKHFVNDQRSRRLLKTFLAGFARNTASCRFADVATAQEFAALIRKLGVPGEHIGIAFGSKADIQDCQKHARKMRLVRGHEGEDKKRKELVLFREAVIRPIRGPLSSELPALWISYIKLESDELGWTFSKAHRLDHLQELEDQRLLKSRGKLSERRLAAKQKREVRTAEKLAGTGKDARLKASGKSSYPQGTSAYLLGLQMLAIHHGISDHDAEPMEERKSTPATA